MQKLAIIDCGSGNIRSCAKAAEQAAKDSNNEFQIIVADSADQVAHADRIILPGQGAFRTCMQALQAMPNMIATLDEVVIQKARPFFGICVGMQLLADCGYEHETTQGLSWLGGDVVALNPADKTYKIPHMGWNKLHSTGKHDLLPDDIDGEYVYFVHSYHLRPKSESDLLLVSDYGEPITAMVARDNIAGTQFHPEKSSAIGLSLLRQFLMWRP